MQSLIFGWSSLLFWASGCWGQSPLLKLDQSSMSTGCPTDKSTVRVEGTVDMNGANSTKYKGIDLVDSANAIIASKLFLDCGKTSSLSCTVINSTYYDVVYEATAESKYSEDNVRLQTFHADTYAFTDSNNVPYPVVKDAIIQKFEINNIVVSLNGGVINAPRRGNITVSYNITGVSLSKLSTFGIIDSSNGNVLALKPASGSEISADIDAGVTKCIYVTYNTTNGCSDGTTVCFGLTDDDGGDACGTGCQGGAGAGAVAGVAVVGAGIVYVINGLTKALISCSPEETFQVVLDKLQEVFEKDLLKKRLSPKISDLILQDKIFFYRKDPNPGGKLEEVPRTSKVGDVAKLLGHPVGGEWVHVDMELVKKGENENEYVEITVTSISLANPPHPKDIAMSSKTDAESGGCGDAIDGSPSNNTDTTSKPEK